MLEDVDSDANNEMESSKKHKHSSMSKKLYKPVRALLKVVGTTVKGKARILQ